MYTAQLQVFERGQQTVAPIAAKDYPHALIDGKTATLKVPAGLLSSLEQV